jgi:thioredoxin 1
MLLLAAVLAAGCLSEDTPQDISYDYDPDSLQAALESGKPTLLQLAASWCSYCVKMEPIMQELKREYEGRANIMTADFDKETDLVARYRAFGTPFFVFHDSGGEVIRTLVGYQSKESIARLLDGLILGSVAYASSPTGELAIGDVEHVDGQVSLSLWLRDDRYVRSGSLRVYLDGEPLKILESEPDLVSVDAPMQVFVFNIDHIRVVAEAPRGRGEVLEAQLSIVDEEGGCGEGIRDIFASYKQNYT